MQSARQPLIAASRSVRSMIAARDSSLGASAADSSSGLLGSTTQRRSGEVLQSFADFPLAVATEVMPARGKYSGLGSLAGVK